MSLGVGAYNLGGAGQCSSMRRKYPWQPCERPQPGTITVNDQYLPIRPILTWPIPQKGGRDGIKPKHKMARKQQAITTTLCKELQASNCIYKSQGAPARGIGPPLVQLGKLLTSIASRLTLPKLHLATSSQSIISLIHIFISIRIRVAFCQNLKTEIINKMKCNRNSTIIIIL